MNIKDTTKPTEIERQLQLVASSINSVVNKVPSQDLKGLIDSRKRLGECLASLNNLRFCLSFNTLEVSSRESLNNPANLMDRVSSLSAKANDATANVEMTISMTVGGGKVNEKLVEAVDVFSKSYGGKPVNVSWSAVEVSGNVESILHARIDKVKDKASFEHASYHVWAKISPKSKKVQMNTGFSSIPPSHGWEDFNDNRELASGLKRFLKQDGF